jgi:hypothetical protein
MSHSKSSPFSDPAQTWGARFSKEAYVFETAPNDWLRAHASVLMSGSQVLFSSWNSSNINTAYPHRLGGESGFGNKP